MKSIKLFIACTAVCIGFSSCSDDFLEEKKNYGNFDKDKVYDNIIAARERVDNIYFQMLPNGSKFDGNGIGNINDVTSVGTPDKWSKSTEEYGGFSSWVDPNVILTYDNSDLYDYFYVANDVYSPWGHIRQCNDVIEGVSASNGISPEDKDKLLGQAYFFRGYQYYLMWKLYGGVCLIDHVQNPVGGSNLIVPRATTKETLDFIVKDFERAAEMLPARWVDEANDFGRITSGLALAMKAKALLFYASPLFNRSDDKARWEAAYEAGKAALEKLKEGNFGLTYEANGGEKNAANWAKTWMNYIGSDGSVSEAVFVTLHNTKDNVSGQPNYGKYNNWKHNIRPTNTNGGGGYAPTAEMIDLFPMADGLQPSKSSINYDKLNFWLNRDPRFYRTFAFPGVEWQFNENGVALNGDDLKSIVPGDKYPTGNKYQLWSYTWYDNDGDKESLSASGYSPDLLKTRNTAIYVRKRSDDYHLNNTQFYVFSSSSTNPKGFQKCAAPLITMRFTEVLINFAEAAAGAGKLNDAVEALRDVRRRVGYTGDCGITASDRAGLLAAALYERQIELAYEGKRFDDMRRWMLFDGGVGQEAIKSSWKLTGFGGNTCNFLGVKPLNGTKRHGIIIYCKTTATKDDASDPHATDRPTALTLDEDMSYTNGVYADAKVQAMAEYWQQNFQRKDNNLDGNDDAFTINFRPEYYFFGLKRNCMQTNVTLHQTVGWHDLSRNADGLFDPLSDNAPE